MVEGKELENNIVISQGGKRGGEVGKIRIGGYYYMNVVVFLGLISLGMKKYIYNKFN